jgi:hypothetical protein
LFSAVSWAALSPVSCVAFSFDLNVPGLGEGEGDAALAMIRGDRATAVAPTTPPKAMAAATADA